MSLNWTKDHEMLVLGVWIGKHEEEVGRGETTRHGDAHGLGWGGLQTWPGDQQGPAAEAKGTTRTEQLVSLPTVGISVEGKLRDGQFSVQGHLVQGLHIVQVGLPSYLRVSDESVDQGME